MSFLLNCVLDGRPQERVNHCLFCKQTAQFHFVDRFTVDASSGEIKTAVALDRETTDQHSIRVVSRDKGPPYREAEVNVVINVSDINDHRPAFGQRHYFVEVKEQLPAHVILNLTVTNRQSIIVLVHHN